MEIPASLGWWRAVPGGAEWLDRLPRLAAECAERWQLRLGRAFDGGNVSLVLAAEAADGLPVVLKLNFPEEEGKHEPDALAFWQGVGAVRLRAYDDRRRALLLERCLPGTTLWELEDEEEANGIACAVLRRLWRAKRARCSRTWSRARVGWPTPEPFEYARGGLAIKRYGEVGAPAAARVSDRTSAFERFAHAPVQQRDREGHERAECGPLKPRREGSLRSPSGPRRG